MKSTMMTLVTFVVLVFLQSVVVVVTQPTPVVAGEIWAGSENTHTINRWDSDSNFLGSFAPSRPVPGTNLRRHRHVPGELLIIPDAHRHGDAAPELWGRGVFCVHRRLRQAEIWLPATRNG